MKILIHSLLFLGLVSLGFSLVAYQQPAKSDPHPDLITKDTLLARNLLHQKDSLFEENEFMSALDKIKLAQQLYQKHGLWSAYVNGYVEAAIVADYLDFETRDLLIQQAIATAQQYLPKDDLQLGLAYRQKGESLINQGSNDSSIYFLKLALPILESKAAWDDWTMCQLMVGINQYFLEDFPQMEIELLAAERYLSESEVSHETKINLCEWFGIWAQFTGDYDTGIRYFKQAVDMNFATGDADTVGLFGQYNNLGYLYLRKGDYQRSLEYFVYGCNIYQGQEEENADLSLAYYNVGGIYARLDRYDEAISYLKQSLAINERIEDVYLEDIINANNVLGRCFIGLEQYDSTIFYVKQALAVPMEFGRDISYGHLGIAYKANSQIDAAIQALQKASQLYGNSTHGQNTLWNKDLADCFAFKGDQSNAHKYYQKALIAGSQNFIDTLDIHANPSLSNPKYPIFLLEALHAKAKALSTDDQYLQSSYETYLLSAKLIDSLRATYVLESSQLIWGQKFKTIYGESIEVARRIYEKKGDAQLLDQAFVFMEKSKSALLLDALKSEEGKVLGGVPDSLNQKEKDLTRDIAFYEKQLIKFQEQEDSLNALRFQNYLSQTKLDLASLKEQLQSDYPTYHQLKFEPTVNSISDIQAFLPDEETAFVQYFLNDQFAHALVITKQLSKLIQLDKPAGLLSGIQDFRGTLMDLEQYRTDPTSAVAAYNTQSFQLYKQLIAPLQLQGVKRLILSPDGQINTIPFEVLATQLQAQSNQNDFGKLDYLIEQFQLQYTYSAGLLLKNTALQNQLAAGRNCLAMAPPYKGQQAIAMRGELDQLRGNDFNKLEGTGKEIQSISGYFPGEFDMSESATKAAFLEKAGDFGLLHLAMHGEADFEHANMGNLIFTDVNQAEEENRLYHYEIADLDLNAQLVVLSACETGLGKYAEGEGVFSLARSFMYAGVPSVVMSLWKVNDQSTSVLMTHFYKALAEGKTKSVALHEAKLTYLSEAKQRFKHPFYWGGFVLLGDSQPLLEDQGFGAWTGWLIGVVVLVVGGLFLYGRFRSPNR